MVLSSFLMIACFSFSQLIGFTRPSWECDRLEKMVKELRKNYQYSKLRNPSPLVINRR